MRPTIPLLTRIASMVALLAAPYPLSAQTGDGFDLTWNAVSSGGSSYNLDGPQMLGETLGQVAGQRASGDNFILVSGFWAGGANDCNNNDVDDDFDLTSGFSQDCNTDGIPDECQPSTWVGADGASFMAAGNWNPPGIPASDVIFNNTGSLNNTCVYQASNRDVCLITIGASGAGQQRLRIDTNARLNALTGANVNAGGEVNMQGGELAGGPVHNAANTIRGYGKISSSVINQGLIEAQFATTLTLAGGSLQNTGAGMIRAPFASRMDVQATSVTQSAGVDIRAQAALQFAAALTNSTGGSIALLGGALDALTLTNSNGASLSGFGIIDTNLTNNGNVTVVADTQIVGNLMNDGIVVVQSGLLTVTGSVSGAGTIIGGFGGRDGGGGFLVLGDLAVGSAGSLAIAGGALRVVGDLDLAINEPARLDLTTAILQLTGQGATPQALEVLSTDAGRAVTLPEANLFSIHKLRIGPSGATVQLVDGRDNAFGQGGEVLYVEELQLDTGTTLDLAGRRVYYQNMTPADPQAPGSGVQVIDSVGGGALLRIGVDPAGDLDGDGRVGSSDLSVFIAVLLDADTTPHHVGAADLNGSGTVDGGDIQPFTAALIAP